MQTLSDDRTPLTPHLVPVHGDLARRPRDPADDEVKAEVGEGAIATQQRTSECVSVPDAAKPLRLGEVRQGDSAPHRHGVARPVAWFAVANDSRSLAN